MNKVLMGISVAVVVSTTVWAAPFLVCDPQSGVQVYKLTGPVWVPATVPAQPDGAIRMDITAAEAGAITSLTVKACKSDPIWGEQCSAAVPFEFTRPAAPPTPAGIRLVP
jgi:hypothetical protein